MRYTKETFIAAARVAHGDKYDYNKTVYVSYNKKLTITCPIHGDFEQAPNYHIGKQRQGCPQCGKEAIKDNNRSSTTAFITKAKKLYGDKYDYSQVVYINNRTPVKIVCPEHGAFECTPHDHLSKRDRRECLTCSKVKFKDTMSTVISRNYENPEYRAKAIAHGDRSYKRGYHNSLKSGLVYYRSALELEWYQKMDVDPSIVSYVAEPFPVLYEFEGKTARYFPDLLVHYTDGSKKLVEIKPEFIRSSPRNLAKFEAAKKYSETLHMPFEVW